MSQKHRRQSAEGQWEQALIDAYADHRWHVVLDPLYEEFQRWKNGECDHLDMDEAIHRTHKECQKVYSFLSNHQKMLLELIQYDREWFDAWLKDHPAPPGMIRVYPSLDELSPGDGDG